MEKGLIVHSIIRAGGKFLITKRARSGGIYGGLWDTPGGTLEDGEDPAAGARREAREETGLGLNDLSLFYCYSHVDRAKDKQFVTLVFQTTPASVPVGVTLDPREHEDSCWVDLDEVKSYALVPWLEQCVGHMRNGSLEI